MWLLLMLIILLANGMSSFGLKVLAAWGLPAAIKFPYLTIWYAAGLFCFGIPLLLRKERGGLKEARWGALIALLSIGGQLAMADALNAGIPGNGGFFLSPLVGPFWSWRLLGSSSLARSSAYSVGLESRSAFFLLSS